jgi:hypothetical protein
VGNQSLHMHYFHFRPYRTISFHFFRHMTSIVRTDAQDGLLVSRRNCNHCIIWPLWTWRISITHTLTINIFSTRVKQADVGSGIFPRNILLLAPKRWHYSFLSLIRQHLQMPSVSRSTGANAYNSGHDAGRERKVGFPIKMEDC